MALTDLQFIPVTAENANLYLELGMQSYREHYLHLWQNADPTDYFSTYFTEEAIRKELQAKGLEHFIVRVGSDPIGVVKLNDEKSLPPFPDNSALLLEKIYFLNAFVGKGYGKIALKQIEKIAASMGKRWLWLDTMQKGKAKNFYFQQGFELLKEIQLHYPNAIDAERPMIVLVKDLRAS